MAGRVQQVDVVVAPIEFDTSAEDRDATFLFFGIVVGVGGSMVDTTDPMLGSAKEQHSFGDCRFTGIDVSDDADVTKFCDVDGHETAAEFLGRESLVNSLVYKRQKSRTTGSCGCASHRLPKATKNRDTDWIRSRLMLS